MSDIAPRCRACGAFLASNVCPVCADPKYQQPRSILIGVALLGLVAGGLAVSSWAGLLWWKWHRWLEQFGHTGEPPERADALSMAVALGFLLFAVVGVGSMVVVAWLGRK